MSNVARSKDSLQHMQHQLTMTTLCLIRLSRVRTLPKVAFFAKNATFLGTLLCQVLFHGDFLILESHKLLF